MAVTKIADIIVPERFTPYVQTLTKELSALVQSGAMVDNEALDELLAGGGITFNVPNFLDLPNDSDNIGDDTGGNSTPNDIPTAQEIAVRLNRNNSWGASDLSAQLAGADPMQAIANRVAAYWTRRLQLITIAVVNGLFADNAAVPTGTDTHVQNDMTVDISGGAFVDGVTTFSAEAFIDAETTMGDAASDLAIVTMHSVVFAKAKKNNLIDFIPDSRGEVEIPFFLGRRVIVDDGVPNAGGVYDTWLFGTGALQMGTGTPKVPTEPDRNPEANNGSGEDILYSRVEWTVHPTGHQYIGAAAQGGPTNATLAAAASWSRVFPERKQVPIARLITRES